MQAKKLTAGDGWRWLGGGFAFFNVHAGAGPNWDKAKEIDIEFQKFCLENEIKLQLGQIAINTEEAKSSSLFVAGWRPAIGWTCGASLAYSAILEPVLRFVAQVMFKYAGAFPVIDTNLTLQILMGMLGLVTARSFDKLKGTAK